MNHLLQKIHIIKFTDRFVDIVLVLFSLIFGIVSERLYHGYQWNESLYDSYNIFFTPYLIIIFYFTINYFEKNQLYRLTSLKTYFLNLIKIIFFSSSIIISTEFLTKVPLFYRSTLIFFIIISFLLLFSKRLLTKLILNQIRMSGSNLKNILIIGFGKRTDYLISKFRENREFGLIVKHIIDFNDIGMKNIKYKIEVSNDIADLKSIIINKNIDEVFFTSPIKLIKNSKKYISFLNSYGVNYHVVIDRQFFELNTDQIRIKPEMKNFYGLPTISYHSIPANLYKLYFKNFIEKLFSFFALIIFSPIILIVSTLIKIDSKGPIFFKQQRIGLHARKFNLIKFRTMINNADSLKKNLLDLNQHDGPVFKIENDPRITNLGKILRKYSIDEIPQFINVLIGDMNLVGPRPPLMEEIEKYKDSQLRRLSVKPGITGLWQINGRNEIKKFEDWIKLDLEYIDNWSLLLDLKIVIKTIPTILKGTGK